MSEAHPAFVRLAVVSDLMTARITVARLQAEGIEARVPGEGLGPYRLTVGDLAATEIWVAADRLADARLVMLESEIDGLADPAIDHEDRPLSKRLMVVGVVALLTVVVYRLLSVLT